MKRIANQNLILREAIEKVFISKAIENAIVLDLGCADIRDYSEFLIQKAKQYYGVDISDIAINIAKEKLQSKNNCILIQSSVESCDLPVNYFDVIVCNNMLAYTNQELTISKIYSSLKNNGICISFFNNTWQYSVFKIFYPFKPFLIELVHSFVVIFNTIFYSLIGIKLFHTIFNREKLLKNIILNHRPSFYKITTDYDTLPYSVIDFIFIK